jgi:hypothetical protein
MLQLETKDLETFEKRCNCGSTDLTVQGRLRLFPAFRDMLEELVCEPEVQEMPATEEAGPSKECRGPGQTKTWFHGS